MVPERDPGSGGGSSEGQNWRVLERERVPIQNIISRIRMHLSEGWEGIQVPSPPLRTYMPVKSLFKWEECLGSLESQGEGCVVANLYAPVELGAYLLSSLLLSEDTWHASCPTFLLQQKQKVKK